MARKISFKQAILEATEQCMAKDPSVYIIGLGVSDPKGIFGTTLGLKAKYGTQRVMDMPVSENSMTGIVIGSALVGMRPIMTHQRMDFMLLSLEQVINNAAKWHYMFGGKIKVPMVIRCIVGWGWGQGPQHSQSLQSLFAHIPGLKVIMPTTAYDAKGLLISSIEDNNPVIFIEHRWLYDVEDEVPEDIYRVPIGRAKTMRFGDNLTIVASSYMSLEALKAAEMLTQDGISAEVVDIRTLRPMDRGHIIDSVRKTGRLIVADHAWCCAGVGAEVLATVVEQIALDLKCNPIRLCFPECPAPTSRALANHFYPRSINIVNAARGMFGLPQKTEQQYGVKDDLPLDVPNKMFKGPF